MTEQTIVVAGSSIAGLSAARELRRGGFEGDLVMLDRDPHAPYRRPEVSKGLLNGGVAEEKVFIPWPPDMDAKRLSGVDLLGLDHVNRRITGTSNSGEIDIEYSGLVIATGCEARPAAFQEMDGVHSLRSFGDAERFRGELEQAHHVVIAGAGFVGLEVAAASAALGKEVTVVEPMELPLAHILGHDLSTRVLDLHQGHGITFLLGRGVVDLEPDRGRAVGRAILTDGSSLPADIVLVAIGARPSVEWLTGSGLDVTHGVQCDATCAVIGAERVVAAGDVALWENHLYGRHMRVEHWANAIEQGGYAARRLLGTHDPGGFISAPYFWSDQHGRRIQSIGSTFGFDHTDLLDDDPERFVVAYFREDRLVAAAGLVTGPDILRFKPLVLEGADRDAVARHHDQLARKVGSQ